MAMTPGLCWRLPTSECTFLFPANRYGIFASDHWPLAGSCRTEEESIVGRPEYLQTISGDGNIPSLPIAISDVALANIYSVFKESGSPVYVSDPVDAFGFPPAIRIRYQAVAGYANPYCRLYVYNEAGQLLGSESTHIESGEALQLVYPVFEHLSVEYLFDLGGIVINAVGIERIYDIELELPTLNGANLGSIIIIGDANFTYDLELHTQNSGISGIHEQIASEAKLTVELDVTQSRLIG